MDNVLDLDKDSDPRNKNEVCYQIPGFHTEFFSGGGGGSLRIQVVLIPIIASWGSGGAVSSPVGPRDEAPGSQKQ